MKRRERVKACEWSLRAVAHGVARANGARGRARRPRGALLLPEVEEGTGTVGPGGQRHKVVRLGREQLDGWIKLRWVRSILSGRFRFNGTFS